ncbi:MAG: sugar transferase [Opitutales bacterium]|jgi:lipopolysaccharide/colanic/teichoic acid biosynthesis glycosyltransferase|nr:sugar transferase [Opitutales bacterium]MDG2254188.1 sugar transferase [Opitutaceae bacterium]MBT5169245.1 sugar transferase [Opitutales bacterium]MBT5815820.1 sugar transferase [Opitutales bacterium]MBT6379534.1 sugar transferase [Opitutales bacterium]
METQSNESNTELADYWARAATPSGRASLTLRSRFKRSTWNAVTGTTIGLKRLFDIFGSTCALIVLSPILAITAACIKFEDPGPVFFTQKRVGLKGNSFLIWKFRSMVSDAEKVAQHMIELQQVQDTVEMKLAGDPRVTRVGNFIRKYSIDELPQFWNVFIGDMSIVGPRPVVTAEVVGYTVEERQRLLAKPGLTCFWQIGGRTDLNFENQVRLDVEYIRSNNIWLDIKLLLLTVPAVLLGKGAY